MHKLVIIIRVCAYARMQQDIQIEEQRFRRNFPESISFIIPFSPNVSGFQE